MTKIEKAHADASPSSASIWLKCPASVTQARGRARLPTVYTREGSAAHVVAEHLAMGLLPPREVDVEGVLVEVDEDMLAAVEVYAAHIANLAKTADHYMLETKVTVSGLSEPLSGTADFIAWTGKTIDVVDLKYGKGVPVAVVDNPQLRIYGLGAFALRLKSVPLATADTIRMSVVQPRMSGPAVQTETLTRKELLAFREKTLKPALRKIADGDNTEVAGEWCRWCVRAGECRTLAKVAQDEARMVFEPTPEGVATAGPLDDGELAAILEQAEMISAWVEMVRAEASRRLDHGRAIPGWKLVAKQARRKWIDADATLPVLNAKFPDLVADMVKLDTVAAVERVLKAAKADTGIIDVGGGLVSKESSGTTLVREADPRAAVASDARSVFEQLTESLADPSA